MPILPVTNEPSVSVTLPVVVNMAKQEAVAPTTGMAGPVGKGSPQPVGTKARIPFVVIAPTTVNARPSNVSFTVRSIAAFTAMRFPAI